MASENGETRTRTTSGSLVDILESLAHRADEVTCVDLDEYGQYVIKKLERKGFVHVIEGVCVKLSDKERLALMAELANEDSEELDAREAAKAAYDNQQR